MPTNPVPAPAAAGVVLSADEIAAVATTRRMIADAEETWRSMGCFDLDRPRGSEPVPMKCCRALLAIADRLCAALAPEAPTGARNAFLADISRELDRAYRKHGREPWGRHEFYAILREEVDELWDAVKGDARFSELYSEVVQVAAMCFRYIETGDRYAGPHPIECESAALASAEPERGATAGERAQGCICGVPSATTGVPYSPGECLVHGPKLVLVAQAAERGSATLTERLARANEALEKFGGHMHWCEHYDADGAQCTCGYDAARRAAGGAE